MRGAAGLLSRLLLALLLGLLPAAGASAQAVDLTRPDPIADRLTEVRLDIHAERRDAGIALLVGGLASVVGGAIVAGVGNEDPFWLMHGIGHLGWGAVNAGLSFGLLDLGDGARARIEEERGTLRGEPLAEAREQVIRDQDRGAALFALNLGLDVLYLASAALLYALADQLDPAWDAPALRGYATAQLGQGAFLFVFDLVEWIGAASRGDRAAAVPRPQRW